MRTPIPPHTLLSLLISVLLLGGCTLLEEKKIDYKSAGTVPSLEVPPDLVLPGRDSRFVVPETPRGAATYSAYAQQQGARPGAQVAQLLPRVDKVRLERAGTQRWLVVDLPPQQVWPVVKDFWQELGFIVNLELPEAGVLETDWAENRARIPQDLIRRTLGRLIDAVYSTAERDKFRTRLEPTADGKGTEIYISHRGMIEVFEGTQGGGDQGTGRTVWQPRPPDPELEAEMLRRLMVRLGVEETRAQTLLAQAPAQPQAALTRTADGTAVLALPEPFDRAWRRVGLALDRVGFTVEDRNRAEGVYFVRYADPEAGSAKREGLLSRLAFWRDDADKLKAQRYRVRLASQGGTTQVSVTQEDGKPAGETGNRIASLLYEQLK
ncbi:MAG: outer membrane protein assembly factor BamC [Thiobacillaceae bacterium]|nr:outer membrane protein assembly factor BamC [Thiobacillaceae bacterium]MCX7673172.1 outer membrane protein assembly factor BamC [Thiobacillaceae bacterium]MDW8322755.1 outer membrane protein assembly factor BamC [Burkholderiales bacterium]